MRAAILGASGAVGRTMLEVLERRLPAVDAIVPLASERSRGLTLTFRGRDWRVDVPRPGAFEGCDIALFSAGAGTSRDWAAAAVAEGAVVIDNSSAWRMEPDVPLVVPEVNAARAADRPRGIIANPNCSTIQVAVVLEGLRRAAGLRRVVLSTYQSVSGAGQKGVAALRAELEGGDGPSPDSPFTARIAGNVLPRVGPVRESGWTEEEEKMRNETRKILDAPALPVAATCVRVPVEVGHAVTVAAETERVVTPAEARAALASMPGVRVAGPERDPTPLEVAGTDEILVGRLRQDPDQPNVLHMWIVADNLRKGAATNAVQIAEVVLGG